MGSQPIEPNQRPDGATERPGGHASHGSTAFSSSRAVPDSVAEGVNRMPDRPAKVSNPKPAFGRRGVVAVILRNEQFLVIRRSQMVTAPGKLCFPGGGIEPGESEEEALAREMMEELALPVVPQQRLWRSTTPWGTKLAWWLADTDAEIEPVPDPSEVAEVFWLRQLELMAAGDLLPSVPQFIQAWRTGKLALPIDWTPSGP